MCSGTSEERRREGAFLALSAYLDHTERGTGSQSAEAALGLISGLLRLAHARSWTHAILDRLEDIFACEEAILDPDDARDLACVVIEELSRPKGGG